MKLTMGFRTVKVVVPDNHGATFVCWFYDDVLLGLQRLECHFFLHVLSSAGIGV